MIVIPPIFPAASADATRHVGPATNGVSFDQALQSAQRAPASPPTTPSVAVNATVLYEIVAQEKIRRDREARQRGRALLDALTDLQRACLTGRPVDATLDGLSRLLMSIPLADDPRLEQVMRAIAVRATVELCRLQPA